MLFIDLKDTNGKSLPKSYYKILNKLYSQGLITLGDEDIEPSFMTNPFSGKQVKLVGYAVQLATWILSTNPYPQGKLTRQDWNNARYIFNVCWPEEYYDLID